jgi:hypothetical protein
MQLISHWTAHPTGIAESVGNWNGHVPFIEDWDFSMPVNFCEDVGAAPGDFILFNLGSYDWEPYGPYIEIDHLTLAVYYIKNHTASSGHNVTFYLKTGGNYYPVATNYPSNWGGGYYTASVNLTQNPATGGPWTPSDLEGLQAGIYIPSVPGGATTQIGHLDVYGQGWYIAPPYVSGNAVQISDTEAQLRGYLSYSEGESSECWIEWGPSESYGNESAHEILAQGDYFYASITDMIPGQPYHFRTRAENSYGVFESADRRVRDVQTLPATGIGNDKATLNGQFFGCYAESYYSCNFRWGTDTNYGNITDSVFEPSPGQMITAQITGLTPGVTYHFMLDLQLPS